MNKLYIFMLIVMGSQCVNLYGTPKPRPPLEFYFYPTEDGSYKSNLDDAIELQNSQNYKEILLTLSEEPNAFLRGVAASGNKFILGSLKLMLSHIHHALDQGGKFDLTGIEKSHIYWLASLAVSLNDLKTVKALLEEGRLISHEYNRTILSGEAKKGRFAYQSNISLLSNTFDTLRYQKNTDMFHLLISFGADINNDRGIFKNTLLHKAIDKGESDLVEFLLMAGARLDVKNDFGQTPVDHFQEEVRINSRRRDQEQDTRIATLLEEYQKERILHPISC